MRCIAIWLGFASSQNPTGLVHHMFMTGLLILDLNATCSECQYPIPPDEMIVVSPGKLKCPKCECVFSAQKGNPIDKKPRQDA
jgi:hypothetical protein